MNKEISKIILSWIIQISCAFSFCMFWRNLEIYFYGVPDPSGVDTIIFAILWVPWYRNIEKWIGDTFE